jgi:hypothetical protein
MGSLRANNANGGIEASSPTEAHQNPRQFFSSERSLDRVAC